MPDPSKIDTQQTEPAPGAGRKAVRVGFGPFVVDRGNRLLLSEGTVVHVQPKAIDLLLCLLERPGDVFSKEHLIERLWGETAVTDASLTETVRVLRNALGDDAREPAYVQTVHRRGYRFLAPVHAAGGGPATRVADLGRIGVWVGRRLGPWSCARMLPWALTVFVFGAAVGIGELSFVDRVGTLGAAGRAAPVRRAKLFIGAVERSAPVFRYEVGITGVPELDLTIEHPSFDLPGWFAFSPLGEMFVVNHFGGTVARFLDPQGVPVFNGSIPLDGPGHPGWAVYRGDELFIADSFPPGRIRRFLFDAQGHGVPNGQMMRAATGAIAMNPATGELFSPRNDPPRIERYLVDDEGELVSNGSFSAAELNTPHGMVFSPWGELFVANGYGNNVLRFVFDAAGNVSSNGLITESTLGIPLGIDFSPWGELFVANRNDGLIHRWVFDASFNPVFDGTFFHPHGIHDLLFAPTGIEVSIDIRPGKGPNSVALGSGGTVPVAILSTVDFDATTIDPTSVHLSSGKARLIAWGTEQVAFSDVDGDRVDDVVVHMTVVAPEVTASDAGAVLIGQTYAGIAFIGRDVVRVERRD